MISHHCRHIHHSRHCSLLRKRQSMFGRAHLFVWLQKGVILRRNFAETFWKVFGENCYVLVSAATSGQFDFWRCPSTHSCLCGLKSAVLFRAVENQARLGYLCEVTIKALELCNSSTFNGSWWCPLIFYPWCKLFFALLMLHLGLFGMKGCRACLELRE